MQRVRITNILHADTPMGEVTVMGWVRTKRESKDFAFVEINDGSCLHNLQIILDAGTSGWEDLAQLLTGTSVRINGSVVPSPGKGQRWEVKAHRLEIIGTAGPEYPLQKKRHTDEFLRTIAHLRPRTNKYGALFRIRAELSFAVHRYFHERGFYLVHAPILTGSDCEGAGEMFQVTTLPLDAVPMEGGVVRYDEDFFGRPASLTVSGQLAAENLACALGQVYTFGPTFRAENSNTPKHAAEFWMVEPEMAFATLADDMDLAEDLVRELVRYAMDCCREDLALFAQFVDPGLMATLETVATRPFVRLPYAEAMDILVRSGKSFQFPVGFGHDLQTEHERFLTEEYCQAPVIVYDYPKEIKAFYMRHNDDGRTVAAMDLLVPRIGELVGGSAREERLDVLAARMAELGMRQEDYWWYLDLRRFGTVPHAGFGMGFERFLMLVTGVSNIRDVIPFPRTPKHLEF